MKHVYTVLVAALCVWACSGAHVTQQDVAAARAAFEATSAHLPADAPARVLDACDALNGAGGSR